MSTPTYDLIQEQTLGSGQTVVTFSNIPGTYRDLVFEVVAPGGAGTDYTMRFNGDTATNYSRTYLAGDGTNAPSGRTTSSGQLFAMYFNTSVSSGHAHIMSYANTNFSKTVLFRSSDTGSYVLSNVGLWRKSPAEAITSLTFQRSDSATLVSGFTFRLWGIL
jgi:hypothetical protein